MSDDRNEEPEAAGDPGSDPDARPAGADGTMWAFLPIGITFLVLGMAQGVGDGSGTAFFAIGVTFLVLALTTGGAAAATARRRRGTAGPGGGSGPEGEPGGPAHP